MRVSARPREARDKPEPDRILGGDEDDGHRCGRCLGRQGAFATATITATGRRANSAADSGSRFGSPSLHRHTIATFSPSTGPLSFRPGRNAGSRSEIKSGDTTPRNPIAGNAAGCARAISGHAAASPPSPAMNSRRLMCPPKAQAGSAYRVTLVS